MDIQKIVEQALKNGYLTPEMKLAIEQFTDSTNLDKLSIEEYNALDRLMGALLISDVIYLDSTDANESSL